MVRKGPLMGIVLLLFLFNGYAQTAATYRALPGAAEKTYLHVDRSFYITGETIWFKAYVIGNGNPSLSTISKVAYVELLDAQQQALLQAKIEIENGSGNGSWVIPGSLPTGQYIIRVYTQWQRQQSPDTWFHKTIRIVNPDKGLPKAAAPMASWVLFYPEGGELVNGLSSQVAFLLLGEDGQPVDGNGELLNAKKEKIADLETSHEGMGRFRFTPEAGQTYTVRIITRQQKEIAAPVPAAQSKGWVLHYAAGPSAYLEVFQAGENGGRFQLVIHNGEKTLKAFTASSSKEGNRFPFSIEELPAGISYVTLFNEKGEPMAERLLFRRPDSTGTILQSDSTQYHTRTKISLQLQEKGVADLSAAVFRIDSLQDLPTDNIIHYVFLTSHLMGYHRPADYYFSEKAEALKVADLLLLTYGWRSFNSEAYNHPLVTTPEYGGHLVTGTITDKRTGLPAPGIAVYLSVPGERFHFANSVSDREGKIRFELQRSYGTENIIVQTQHTKDSTYQITINSPFATDKTSRILPAFSLNKSLQPLLEDYAREQNLQQAFSAKQAPVFYMPGLKDTTMFYGKPDKTYLLDDYVRFTTMEEVMREYISEVMVRKSQGDFRFRVLNAPFKQFFENSPLVLLDGVPVFNSNKIIAFDPLKIRKMDILTRRYYQGAIAFDGIVSLSTYEGSLGGFELDPSALIIDYAGLQLQRQFNAPVYDSPEQKTSPLADQRHLLYWNPYLKTDTNGKLQFNCYSSDLPGDYVVVVQGMSASGKALYSVKKITILNSK